MTTEVIGVSENGLDITVNKFDVSSPIYKIWIDARMHGDEDECEVAANDLITDIGTTNPSFYAGVSIHVCSLLNPDGKVLDQRENFNNIDLNRDYESVASNEILAVHQHIRSFRPHAIINLHNFPPTQSWLTSQNVAFDHDMLMDYPTSPMCRRTLSSTQFTSLITQIKTDNPTYKYDRYINPDTVGRTRYSSEDITDTRNHLSFRYDVLGFIFEGREPRSDEVSATQKARTSAAQLGACKSTIIWLKNNVSIFTNTLTPPTPGSNYPLRSHYITNTSHTMDMYNTSTHVVGPFTFANFDTDDTNYVFTTYPLGYAVPTSNTALVNHLTNNLGITSQQGVAADKYTIETIHIDAADAWDDGGGVLEDQDPPANVAVTYVRSNMTDFTNYKLFFVSNTDGGYQLGFLLEPRAKYGLPRYRDLLNLPVVAGTDYSILRLMAPQTKRKIAFSIRTS